MNSDAFVGQEQHVRLHGRLGLKLIRRSVGVVADETAVDQVIPWHILVVMTHRVDVGRFVHVPLVVRTLHGYLQTTYAADVADCVTMMDTQHTVIDLVVREI